MPKPKCTDEQLIAAYNQTGSATKAAKSLGIDRRSVDRRLKKLRENAQGAVELAPILPDGHVLAGVSSLVRAVDPVSGETVLQWQKTKQSKEQQEELQQEILQAFLDKLPRAPRVEPSVVKTHEELVNLHILTDYHLGMLAWGEETGTDWDLKIAEDLLVKLFAYSLRHTPKATQGILAQLGDFTHYDSFESITPTSKHLLDSDTRPQKMVRVAIRVLRRCIDMMLKKYDNVYVLMAEGNHDIMSSAWLREAFALFYENEPRVVVETRPDPYYAFPWGKTLLLFHHGHLKRPANIDTVFVGKFKELFGQSEKVYAHMGHLHHKYEKETSLMDVIQHPTLAGMDAYASRHGFLSMRRAATMTYHKQYGEVAKLTVPPEVLE